jgi:hypothetical protein
MRRMRGALGLGLSVLCLTAVSRAQQPVPPQPSGERVLASYPTTEKDGTMRVQCTVTEARKLKDCVNLSLSPQLVAIIGNKPTQDFDARVNQWTAGKPKEPGVRIFIVRFQPPAPARAPDAGVPPAHEGSRQRP